MSRRGGAAPGVRATTVAGTPSSFESCAPPETLDGLEFARILDVIAGRAACALGAQRVRSRVPIADVSTVRDELRRVTELRDIMLLGDPFHAEPVVDVRASLARLAVEGAVLDGPALLELGRTLEAMRVVRRELERVAERSPLMASLLVPLPPDSIGRAILRTILRDGTVRDRVDDAVDRTRHRIRDTRAKLLTLLDRTLHRLERHEAPEDASVTVRSGRYVVPVARAARRRVPGIVHAESSSGATLFIEPVAAVELGNALNGAQAEETRAVHALLRKLCDEARPHLDAAAAGWEMCLQVDDLCARARYALDVDAAPPRIIPAPGEFRIRGARHPLLLAEGVDAVPFDLELDPEELAVVVSGPNTGGKTVMLKTVGLASALAQAGVLPPLGEGSVLPVFSRILADIGDHQSIEANLSTFAAHIEALVGALHAAGAETLVLFDEIGSGTDPEEGAALAGAAILALIERGSRVVATTHLGALKRLAAETDGVVNASLHFDAESLSPTYRLTKGIPGRSYGIVIARRLGLPAEVLQQAEARTDSRERSLDILLADAERRAQEVAEWEANLTDQAARLLAAATEADRRSRELDEQEREVVRRERETEHEGRERASRFLLEARGRVEEALHVARAAVSEATAKEARRLVERGISTEAEELNRLERELQARGWKVRSGSGKWETGSAGSLQTTPTVRNAARSVVPHLPVAAASVSEIDLRGMMADEARDALNRAVDAAVLADLPALRIIHGKGTGKLRVVVGNVLSRDRRVASHRLAPPNEGGSGVTIAERAS